mgnify:CR=1 FL=1
MKKTLFVCCALALALGAQAQWKPVGDKIKTPWSEQVNPANVLPEYPRPQLERGDWQNLNGEWEYAIKPVGDVEPATFDGKILVPFAVESSLSGVQKEVGENSELWYKRTFSVPSAWKNKDIMLNFGAVDWKADVFVNDILIGSHKGGFTPFSFNITPYLTGKNNQKLVVRVWDPSDKGYQPRGKQTSRPEGIWYTPVTGIWQTVWLEPVAAAHVTSVKSISNIDNNTLNVTVGTSCDCNSGIVTVKLLDKGQVVASAKGVQGKELRLSVQNPTLWSPSNPYLYDIAVSHADKTMKCHFRPDYTSYHVAVYDTITGNLIKGVTHQGYADSTMWARGQAWAIYGYTVVYRETKDPKYLDFAQKVTDVYLERLPEDKVPYWDFDDPSIPNAPRDASAAAVVASSLLELSTYLPNGTGKRYRDAAVEMLTSLSSDNYQSGKSNPSFLLHSVGHWPAHSEIDASIIYADYYYIEALLRLKRLQEGKNVIK